MVKEMIEESPYVIKNSYVKKIYMICYTEPRYKAEIGKMLYGESKPTVDKWLREEMLPNDSEFPLEICSHEQVLGNLFKFKSQEFNDEWKKEIPDGRAHNKQHYIAKAQPILDYINNEFEESELKYYLEDAEQEKVLDILRSQAFRKAIKLSLPKTIVDEKTVVNFSKDIEPLYHIAFSITYSAGVIFGLRRRYGSMKVKEIVSLINNKEKFEKKVKSKQIKKKASRQIEAMEMFNVNLEQTLKQVELTNIFLNTDITLLKKLTMINPHGKYAAGLVMLPI